LRERDEPLDVVSKLHDAVIRGREQLPRREAWRKLIVTPADISRSG